MKILRVSALLLSIMGILALSSVIQAAEPLVVVGSKGMPNLTKTDLKALFLGFKTKLSNGASAKLLMNGSPEASDAFIRQVLAISTDDYKSHWLSKALSGEGVPPSEFSTDDLVKKVVQEQHVITFIPKSALTPEMSIILTLQ